jgi:hypothetical protein
MPAAAEGTETDRATIGADQPQPSSQVDSSPRSAAGSFRAAAGSNNSSQEELPVQLSAGVALPQSLPGGTAIGFSVDYRLVTGRPQPSNRYLWIIRAAHAEQPWEKPVQLQGAGTLQSFVTAFPPEEGPFETFLAEVTPDGALRISASVLLKSD